MFVLPVDSYVTAWLDGIGLGQADDQNETSPEPQLPMESNAALQIPWYRSQLSKDEQAIYDAIEKGIRDLSADIPVPNSDPATIERCFMFVLFDNPDIFWIGSNYQYTSRNGTIISVQPSYETTDRDFIKARASEMDAIAEQGRAFADQGANTYEKLTLLYIWIADYCVYDVATADSQDIESFFINRVSACAGYSRAFQYICNKMSIPCIYVTGDATANGKVEHHAWNGVDIDGTMTYADVTWGDRDGEAPTDFSWFGLTLPDMSVTHALDYPEYVPAADSDAFEYWTLHGGNFEYFDPGITMTFLKQCISEGQKSTSIRFANAEDMEACHAFFTANTDSASDFVSTFPDKFVDPSGRGVYSIYKQEGLRAVVFVWEY